MIVKMKKITLLCLETEREQAMEQLRDLGIMHVDLTSAVSTPDISSLEQKLQDVSHVYNILSGMKAKDQKASSLSGKEIMEKSSVLLEQKAELEKESALLDRDIETLIPWGNFKQETVRSLSKNGVNILFCMTYEDTLANLEIPENILKIEVNAIRNERYFLLISTEPLDAALFPVVKLPECSLEELQAGRNKISDKLADIQAELAGLAASVDPLKEYFQELTAQYEFVSNRDGMSTDGAIAYINGYVPAPQLDKLMDAAHKNGWAVLADDPAMDDARVPTYLEHPKWLKIIDPLFDFIGITPGYRENDVAVFFLIAFPVFFGMLIGDFGYGMLFVITALLCKYLMRKKEEAQMPLNLLLLLASCSVIWGLLNGSCLGLPRNILPRFLQGLDFLAEPDKSEAAVKLAKRLEINDPLELGNKFTQWFCFLLAGLHLSSARIYKCITDIRNWRCWGHLGWACLIWANFFTAVNLVVFPGTFPKVLGFSLYGIGAVLIIGTTTAEAALNLPSSMIGSFVDVLSYIRLFAVGLSGVYVASCFNDMGMMLLNALPKYLFIVGLIALILVGIFGHILNILLGIMGVMVHAIRLNTLEFSNHIEMQWTGIAYHPFKKKNK